MILQDKGNFPALFRKTKNKRYLDMIKYKVKKV